jgi:hypothetical protein
MLNGGRSCTLNEFDRNQLNKGGVAGIIQTAGIVAMVALIIRESGLCVQREDQACAVCSRPWMMTTA